MNEVIYYGLKVGLIISFIFGFVFYFLSEYMIGGFTQSEEIIQIGANYFKVLVFSFPLVTIGMTCSRVMQGLGFGTPMLIITSMRVILISAPLALYFTRVLDKPIEYVWYSMLTSAFFASTIAFIWMRKIISNSLKS